MTANTHKHDGNACVNAGLLQLGTAEHCVVVGRSLVVVLRGDTIDRQEATMRPRIEAGVGCSNDG